MTVNIQGLLALGYVQRNNVWEKQMKSCFITLFPTQERDIVVRRITSPVGEVVDMRRMKLDEIETDALYTAIVREQNRPINNQVIKTAAPSAPVNLKGKDPGKVVNLKSPKEPING